MTPDLLANLRQRAPAPDRLSEAAWDRLGRQAVGWSARHPQWARPAVLARWTGATVEFLERLEEDRPALEEVCGLGPGPLSSVRTLCSDPHAGGRTVIAFRAGTGPLIYYKPRDGRVEAAFYRLLGELASPDLPEPPAMLTRAGRAWVEGIDGVWSGRETGSASRSAGALLALLDLLQAADMHPDNVAWRDGRLLPVDVETLCHPTLPWENPASRDPADPESVLRVGLLAGVGLPGPVAAEPLVQGFEDLYRRMDESPLDAFLETARSLAPRVLLRATSRYRRALEALDDTSRTEGAPESLLDAALAHADGSASLVPAEVRRLEVDSLARFDIPHFTARPDGTDVTCSASGTTVPEVVSVPGLDRVAVRRAAQGGADLAARVAVIRPALALERMRDALRSAAGRPA